MGAGYFLRDKYDITFYEKNDYAGGHTNTVTLKENGQDVHVDSAFMVYNESTYPLLTRLFTELKVQTKATSMSFSVQHVPTGLEYCGTGLDGLFAQRKNLLNPRFIAMLLEIQRFNKEAVEVLEDEQYSQCSLAAYMLKKGYSDDFLYKFLIPMSSAVWSTPVDTMLQFPAVTLVRFFKNHCFLGLEGHLQWRTCVGGSRQYRDKLLAKVNARVWTDRGVVKVVRGKAKVTVIDTTGAAQEYDKAIIACHADDALALLAEPTALEARLLGAFDYCDNKTTVHSDRSVMPRNKRAWSSWNYRIQKDGQGGWDTTTIYDMNSLQGVSQRKDHFVSINDPGLVDPVKIMWETVYRHPVYSVAGQNAQKEMHLLNQDGQLYFCGAYFRYGFHEDGLWSGLNAARALAGENIWQ